MRRLLTAVALTLTAAAASAQVLSEFPRAANGRPDLSGIWQAVSNAHWNLEPTPGGYPVLLELGAQFAVPPGPGVVVGGENLGARGRRGERERNPRQQALHCGCGASPGAWVPPKKSSRPSANFMSRPTALFEPSRVP